MKISIVCLALNLAFALWLVQPYREAGLGVANTLSAGFNTLLLLYALRRKLSRLGLTQFVNSLLVLLPGAVLAGGIAAGLVWLWERNLGHLTFALKLGVVFVPCAVAGLVYWLVALLGGVAAAKEILVLLRRVLRRPRS
jgi:peptidoglycan biosynthesis protein MviN/MurJ (putative lipid II flippase)